MFGHDDEQQQDNQQPNENDTNSQTVTPDEPQNTDNDDSQNYIMTDAPNGQSDNTTASNDLPSTVEPTTPTSNDAPAGSSSHSDLLSIKQQALQQLTPLVGHLDQSPEEKFRTTMMMSQAADDDSLIQEAYNAAQQITDEKTRAQALLDIVNEINYFTQNQNS